MNTYEKSPELTPLQKKIINEWQKMILVHPSYPKIAKKLRCSPETVQRAIHKFRTLSK